EVEASGSLDGNGENAYDGQTGDAATKPMLTDKTSAMGPRLASSAQTEPAGYQGRQAVADLITSARVSVSLERAFEDSDSADNIPLRHGDHIFVPRVSDVVTVIGAVLHPHSFAAKSGESVNHYIQRSG